MLGTAKLSHLPQPGQCGVDCGGCLVVSLLEHVAVDRQCDVGGGISEALEIMVMS